MFSRVLKGWNGVKIFRVLMSVLIVWSGIEERNNAYTGLGLFFLLFSLWSSGACCAMYPNRETTPPADKDYSQLKADYEEVGAGK